jgi:hypothetical protein
MGTNGFSSKIGSRGDGGGGSIGGSPIFESISDGSTIVALNVTDSCSMIAAITLLRKKELFSALSVLWLVTELQLQAHLQGSYASVKSRTGRLNYLC